MANYKTSALNPGALRAIQSTAPVNLDVLNAKERKAAEASQAILDQFNEGKKSFNETLKHFQSVSGSITNPDDPRFYVMQQQVRQLQLGEQQRQDEELLSKYQSGEVGYDQIKSHFDQRFRSAPRGSALRYNYLQQNRTLHEGYQNAMDQRKAADFEQGVISQQDYQGYLQQRQREEAAYSSQYEQALGQYRNVDIESQRRALAQKYQGGDDLQAQYDELKQLQSKYAQGSGVWNSIQDDINSIDQAIAQERYQKWMQQGERDYAQKELDIQRRQRDIERQLSEGRITRAEAEKWMRQIEEESFKLAPETPEFSYNQFRSGVDMPAYTRSSRLNNLYRGITTAPYKYDKAAETRYVQNWKGVGGRLPSREEIVRGVYGLGRNLKTEQDFVKRWSGQKGRLPTAQEINYGAYGGY